MLSKFVNDVQHNQATLGYGLHRYIEVRGELENAIPDLGAAERRKVVAACDKRDELFFRNWACASHCMDPQASPVASGNILQHNRAWI